MRLREPTATAESGASALNGGHWGGHPEQYDAFRECWLSHRRLNFLTDQFRSARLRPGAVVLEVGAGTGWLLRRLAERFPEQRFIGIEPDETYVLFARAHSRPNEEHVLALAEQLAQTNLPACDVVLSNDVLHHVSSVEATFRGVAAVAADECTWWAIEPNFLNPYTHLKQRFSPGEKNFIPRAALREAAECGWQLTDRRTLFLVPPFVRTPAPWMAAVERRWEGNPVLGGGICLRLRRRKRNVPAAT